MRTDRGTKDSKGLFLYSTDKKTSQECNCFQDSVANQNSCVILFPFENFCARTVPDFLLFQVLSENEKYIIVIKRPLVCSRYRVLEAQHFRKLDNEQLLSSINGS